MADKYVLRSISRDEWQYELTAPDSFQQIANRIEKIDTNPKYGRVVSCRRMHGQLMSCNPNNLLPDIVNII